MTTAVPDKLAKGFIIIGSCLSGIGVLMGAVGAHALRGRLSDEGLAIFHTALQYHLYHALGLVAIGCIARQLAGSSKWLAAAGALMLVGLLLFSGSLYVFTLSDVKYIKMLAPYGGSALICSWFLLAFAVARASN